jgi:hypothetical protein
VTAPVVWKVLITGKAWRMRRLLAFLDPWNYCKEAGYQLCESLISVGSGGVWGQGLGQSRQKLFFLPEAHTDFILAIISEELGFIGVMFLITVFAVIVWRGLHASLRARDLFGSYLAFGITSLLALQALFNMGVVFGLLPTKGLALPFISYGGTSLVVTMFMAGVVANISARNPEPRPRPLWRLWQRRQGPTKNRRSLRGPRIIVELPSHARPAVVAGGQGFAEGAMLDETLKEDATAFAALDQDVDEDVDEDLDDDIDHDAPDRAERPS